MLFLKIAVGHQLGCKFQKKISKKYLQFFSKNFFIPYRQPNI